MLHGRVDDDDDSKLGRTKELNMARINLQKMREIFCRVRRPEHFGDIAANHEKKFLKGPNVNMR